MSSKQSTPQSSWESTLAQLLAKYDKDYVTIACMKARVELQQSLVKTAKDEIDAELYAQSLPYRLQDLDNAWTVASSYEKDLHKVETS